MKRRILLLFGIAGVVHFGINAQTITSAQNEREVFLMNDHYQASSLLQEKAGTVIWGTGGSVGAADGEFQNAFTNTGTQGGYSPTTWTALTVYESSGATTPGNAYWVQSMTGMSQGAYWGVETAIASPTQANGVALFDSDFLDNAGTQGAFGTGTSPTAHRGELISPTIDLTGYADSALAVNFFCKWRNYSTSIWVSLSIDDGATWTDVDINTLLPAGVNAVNEGWVSAVFPSVTLGATNLTQCRIRFIFDGDYYYTMVDDVSISVAPEQDLTIAIAVPGGNTLTEAYEQIQVTNNRYFPISQLSTQNFIYGANVKNFGYQHVMPLDSATLTVNIQKDISGNWTTVHTDVLNIDTVLSGSNGTQFTDTLSSFNWAEVGDFRTVYSVFTTKDNNSLNDTVMHHFTITPNNYISKVTLDTNANPARTRPIFPGGTDFQLFEYGSMFFFPTAGTAGLLMDSLSFTYYVPTGYTGSSSMTLLASIYEWVDGDGDGVLDALGAELTPIGVAVPTLNGLGTTVAEGTYASATTGNFIDPGTGSAMTPLQDNKYYFVTLQINPNLFGGPSTFTSTTSIWLGASEEKNYALNAPNGGANGAYFQPSPVKVVDGTGTGDWNWVGYGADMVPSFGIHLSGACTAPVAMYSASNNELEVSFSNTSTADTSATYSWDFGDGNTSTQQNPVYAYSQPGTYNVCLTVADQCSSVNSCQSITVSCAVPTAIFTDSVSNMNVSFSNSSSLSTSSSGANYLWDFGNGFLANVENPSYTYSAPGTYTICLTVSDQCGLDSACTNVTVTDVGTGIHKNWQGDLKLYPVPVKETLNISGIPFNESYTVKLINNLGQVVITQAYNGTNNVVIDVHDITPGVYQVVITSATTSGARPVVIIK